MNLQEIKDIYNRSLDLTPETDGEFFECAGDLLETDEIKSLEQYVQHDTINRLQHITSVAYMSYVLCKRFSLDYLVTARAGVMHDLFYYDWHEKHGGHRLHGYRHPGFAVKNAKELCGSIDRKTENIIKRHMWPLTPTPPKYKEGFIVCFADKYCAATELITCHKNKKLR